MSTDYKYTIRRKVDNKKIAVFYYNQIKNLYDVACVEFKLKLDPENIRGDEDNQIRYSIDDINNDISKLENNIKLLNMKIFEKKLLIPNAINRDIKDDIESDIAMLDAEIINCMYAKDALAGLRAVVDVFVEDQVEISKNNVDDAKIAYEYNAADLPKTKDGYDPHLWSQDVYIEAKACY